MKYQYEDREGQIAELYSCMSVLSVNIALNRIHITAGLSTHDVSKDCASEIEEYRAEVERLNHPILRDGLERLERMVDGGK